MGSMVWRTGEKMEGREEWQGEGDHEIDMGGPWGTLSF